MSDTDKLVYFIVLHIIKYFFKLNMCSCTSTVYVQDYQFLKKKLVCCVNYRNFDWLVLMNIY